MDYSIKAIPTRYAGVEFRSRLEARWAAFFDLAAWEWEYEPFDLDGWAPDFIIRAKHPVLIEVKPFDMDVSGSVKRLTDIFCEFGRAGDADGLRMAIATEDKIQKNDRVARDVAYAKALAHRPKHNILCLGVMPRPDYRLNPGYLLGSPRGAATYWATINDDMIVPKQQEFWKEAGNRVQWKPRA